MKTIYLVRHGESDENIGGTIVGGSTPLSEEGRAQAERIAERAERLPIEVIISSTYLRAQQTAEPIARRTGKPVELCELFIERRMPSWGLGKTILDPDVIAMEEELTRKLLDHDHRHSDEENFADIKLRATQALAYLEARPEEKILVVSHGAFLKTLIGQVIFGDAFTGREAVSLMQKMKTMNTGITVFMYDPEHKYGPWRLSVYNDHAHLG